MRFLGRSGITSSGNTAIAHKSADEMGTKIGPRRGSSLYANTPLNILGGGGWRWPNTPQLDVETLVAATRHSDADLPAQK